MSNKDINWKKKTLDTYNKSAKELAEYFRGIGSRQKDIDHAFSLVADRPNPSVLEIGCGDGRDAKYIISRTSKYLGFDISSELIKLAKKYVPDTEFIVDDANSFDFGENKFDIIFAFASLLHLNKPEIEQLFKKANKALKIGGVMFISLRLSEKYKEQVKIDRFGERMFYYYNPEIIRKLTEKIFTVQKVDGGFVTTGNTKWFEMALLKS